MYYLHYSCVRFIPMKLFSILVSLIVLTTVSAQAQITITTSDLQKIFAIGSTIQTDTALPTITVNVGTASSTAQTFDLSNASFVSEYAFPIISIVNAPLSAYYSNLGATTVVVSGNTQDTTYSYGAFSNGNMIGIGKYDISSGIPKDTEVYSPFDLIFQCPISYGSQWTSAYTYVKQSFQNSDTTHYYVDAFGTLKLPMASYDCLRITGIGKASGKTISYIFITKEGFFAGVTINKSDSGKSSVTPKTIGVTAYSPSPVREGSTRVSDGLSLQVYPSLLSSAARTFSIAYNTPQEGSAEIDLVNIYGETVAHISSGVQSAGAHLVNAHVSNLPTGYYLCSLRANGNIVTRPIVIAK